MNLTKLKPGVKISVRKSLRIDPELAAKLESFANKYGYTETSIVEQGLDLFFEDFAKKNHRNQRNK